MAAVSEQCTLIIRSIITAIVETQREMTPPGYRKLSIAQRRPLTTTPSADDGAPECTAGDAAPVKREAE